MNRRPGQIKVTIETGYCSFCDRTRNLRREERHLGALVRTIVACESCHRTLSSTMGVAGAEAPAAEEAEEAAVNEVAAEAVTSPQPEAEPKPKPEPKEPKRATPTRSTSAANRPKAPKSRAAKTK
jgi:predicted component of type VI protein secretion system